MKEAKIKTKELTEKAIRDLLKVFPFRSYQDAEGMRVAATEIIEREVQRLKNPRDEKELIKLTKGYAGMSLAEYKLIFIWSPRKSAVFLRCHLGD